ncbi:MAG TPA: NlpC/P60 family protein [Acidimicrobiales bacterium]|nr:NlpC/P60 family protein [Acidimicrobiales bacterium]
MTPRHRRLGVLVGIALLYPLVTASGSFADPIGDKRAEAARLQEQLEKQGERVSVLAERSNRARLKVSEVEVSLARTQADVARSDERLQVVRGRLAQAAVLAYVHGGSNALIGQLVRGGRDDMVVRTQYLRVTSADQRRIIGEVRSARQDLEFHSSRLETERKAAADAAEAAESASQEAVEAEDAQRAVLGRVTGELGELVAAEQARKEAEAARNRPVPVIADTPRITEPPRPQTQSTQAPAQSQPQGTTTVPAQATSAPPASGKGAIAVAEARRQLGKPYVYGGSGPDSFDCSGLTAWAWKAAGVTLSHSAYTQWFETTRVPVDAVQPGDLLFFGKNGVESIHHNAIYIGNGDMIEASQTGTPIRIRGWRGGDLVGAGRPG